MATELATNGAAPANPVVESAPVAHEAHGASSESGATIAMRVLAMFVTASIAGASAVYFLLRG